MILACPKDSFVLDLGDWELLSIHVQSGDTSYRWRCAGPGEPHAVVVLWGMYGHDPIVTTDRIVAVTPAVSHLPNRGVAPAPLVPRTGTVPKMIIVKRPR